VTTRVIPLANGADWVRRYQLKASKRFRERCTGIAFISVLQHILQACSSILFEKKKKKKKKIIGWTPGNVVNPPATAWTGLKNCSNATQIAANMAAVNMSMGSMSMTNVTYIYVTCSGQVITEF
jgi:hypothetical protein